MSFSILGKQANLHFGGELNAKVGTSLRSENAIHLLILLSAKTGKSLFCLRPAKNLINVVDTLRKKFTKNKNVRFFQYLLTVTMTERQTEFVPS